MAWIRQANVMGLLGILWVSADLGTPFERPCGSPLGLQIQRNCLANGIFQIVLIDQSDQGCCLEHPCRVI
jgi:hypothetical protein